jgi:hypothetical protein
VSKASESIQVPRGMEQGHSLQSLHCLGKGRLTPAGAAHVGERATGLRILFGCKHAVLWQQVVQK